MFQRDGSAAGQAMSHRIVQELAHFPSAAAPLNRWSVAVAVVLAASGLSWPAAGADRTETLVSTVCQACHMADGNSVIPTFPKLAGQQPEYLAKQLQDLLEGKRNNDAMAAVLSQITRGDVPGLAAYYARQKATPGVVKDPSVVDAGRRIYEDGNEATGVPSCAGCHEDDALGNPRYPRLAGQHQEYFVQEMQRFRKGERTNGKFMGAISERLTDAEIAALAEYLAGL
jgi:cytochrome c553